ncbi:MAG: MarR family transcriptional regulator [Planctomycetota bacterium]
MKPEEIPSAVLDAIRQIEDGVREPGMFTTAELREAMNVGTPAGMRMVKGLLKQGLIEPARVPIKDLAMRDTTTCGWKWIGEEAWTVE